MDALYQLSYRGTFTLVELALYAYVCFTQELSRQHAILYQISLDFTRGTSLKINSVSDTICRKQSAALAQLVRAAVL